MSAQIDDGDVVVVHRLVLGVRPVGQFPHVAATRTGLIVAIQRVHKFVGGNQVDPVEVGTGEINLVVGGGAEHLVSTARSSRAASAGA